MFEFLLLSFCFGFGFVIFGLVWRCGLRFQELCLGVVEFVCVYLFLGLSRRVSVSIFKFWMCFGFVCQSSVRGVKVLGLGVL